jgi:glycosyltransferase involved in cell wall biosynthesis
MKICIISKYPPIEGGVSSEIYWVAKALGKLNHKIYVVTNSKEVEEDYREDISKYDSYQLEPKNVKIYSTGPLLPYFIPFSKSHVAKLANLAIQVIRKHDIDLIYSKYLLPYGVAGLIVKQITRKPLMVSHAGSDITRLFDDPSLKSIFIEVFKGADMISTISGTKNKILKRCEIDCAKLILGLSVGINIEEFHPDVKPFDLSPYLQGSRQENLPTFLYLGKISKLKKTFEFVKACSSIKKEHFRIIFVVGNTEKSLELNKYVEVMGLKKKAIFLPFQPPWRIPSLVNVSTCVVSPESSEQPFLPKGIHYPKIAREAMACGRCVIIGKGVAKKGAYQRLQDGVNICIVDPDNTKEFANRLRMIIKNPDMAVKIGLEARKFSEATEYFEERIKQWVMAYKALLFTHSLKMRDRS